MHVEKKQKKNDIRLFLALILTGAVIFAVINLFGSKGAEVQVVVDGAVVESHPLSINKTIDLHYHKGYNQLVIKDGAAFIKEADCPDKLCVDQRKISLENESIVCLPHKVVVKISGGEQPEVDGVL